MDSKLLTKYLNYLHTESNRILKKDDIDKFDVDNLKRDLATLKNSLNDSTVITGELLDAILALNLSR